jgi:PAS domain S-box-containing protein
MSDISTTIPSMDSMSTHFCSITDNELRFLYANVLFQKQFGLHNETWKGKPFHEVVQSFQVEKCVQAKDECIRNPGKVISIEIESSIDGNDTWFRWEMNAVKSSSGVVEAISFIGTDITAEKRLNKELAQLGAIFDNVSDIIVTLDGDFYIKNWNLAAERRYNLNKDLVLNKHYKEVFDLELIDCTLEDLHQSLRQTGIWKGDSFVTPKGGQKIKLTGSTIAITNKQGNIERYITINRDTTHEWQTSQHLAYKQNEFSSFMENAPVLAWINDEDGTLQYMNTLFKKTFGLDNSAIGQNIYNYYPESMRPNCISSDRLVLELGSSINVFEEGEDSNGEKIYYEVFKFPVKEPGGKKLIGGQALDITAKTLTKTELMKSYERFEYAGKATRDIIWDWDLSSNKIQRMGGYKKIFGYEIDDDLIEFDSGNIHPDDADEVVKSWQQAMADGDTRWQKEFRYRCADGSYKVVIDQAYIIRDAKGNATRLIGTMQDITEERRLQQQVLDAEKKKKLDMVTAAIEAQEKERKEISVELHDNVNQLLAASILYLKTARAQPQKNNTLLDESLQHVEKAITEIRHLTHSLNPGSLIINGLTAALTDFTAKLRIPGNFSVNLQIADNFGEQKLSQQQQLGLYRIVQESFSNTLKYANATDVTIQLQEDNDTIKLVYKDNGNGFDMLSVKKGLGLINMQNRVENLNGKITITSAPGKGCTLIAELAAQDNTPVAT